MYAAEPLERENTEDRPTFTLIEGGLGFRKRIGALVPHLYPRALQLCRNQTEAHDLVQDTMLRALRFERQFQPESNLRAWLNQVLYSVFITKCRRRTRERRALASLTEDPCAWPKADPSPSMGCLPKGVKRALESMPTSFAEVVLLVDVGEQSYKDAALQLSVPVGTVMSRLHRGRKLLRDALASSVA